jgi:hypothetical protein
MEIVGIFLAGFASGWAVRTTVDSSRHLAVKVLSKLYGVVDRATRAVEMARAKYEADRARAAHASRTAGNDQGGRRVASAVQDQAA